MGRVIVCAGYRDWAKRIFEMVKAETRNEGHTFIDVERPDDLFRVQDDDRAYTPNIVLVYGWSWIIPEVQLESAVPFVCLHPSPLPRYRGGSPLQRQIMAGEYWSAVTLFKLKKGPVDSGPIIDQRPLTLEGSLADILGRISIIGANMTLDLLRRAVLPLKPQIETEATTYPRRTPAESELTPNNLHGMTARQLHDKIRALDHPDYPPAFIRGADGKRLVIHSTELEDK